MYAHAVKEISHPAEAKMPVRGDRVASAHRHGAVGPGGRPTRAGRTIGSDGNEWWTSFLLRSSRRRLSRRKGGRGPGTNSMLCRCSVELIAVLGHPWGGEEAQGYVARNRYARPGSSGYLHSRKPHGGWARKPRMGHRTVSKHNGLLERALHWLGRAEEGRRSRSRGMGAHRSGDGRYRSGAQL